MQTNFDKIAVGFLIIVCIFMFVLAVSSDWSDSEYSKGDNNVSSQTNEHCNNR